jgi:hypothetical protein
VSVIVNNKEIYPLLSDKPVVIEVKENKPRIVVTDGFHFTRPVELIYKVPSYYRFKVACTIDDLQLLGGSFFLIFLYMLGFFTGFFILKLLSFLPVICFLAVYYLNRRSFIKIIQDHLSHSNSRRNG